MVQLFHDTDFLVDIFFEKGLFLEMRLTNDLYSEKLLFFYIVNLKKLLFLASTTYPKAPLPIDLIIS